MLATAIERFGASAQSLKRGPWLEPSSRIAYSLITVWVVGCAAIFAVTDFYIGISAIWMALASLFWISLSGLLARSYGWPRVALFLEAVSIPPIVMAMIIETHLFLASISGPFVDESVIKVDALLGLHWLTAFRFYQAHDWLVPISGWAYAAFSPQMVAVPLALSLRQRQFFWRYVTAFLLTSLATISIFPFVPSVGPYIYYDIPLGLLPGIGEGWPWQWHFGEWIGQLQRGEVRDMTKIWAGLIQTPSFHAAMGVLFIWATSRFQYLRWPTLVINVCMILATIVTGAHYFTDVISGSLIAMLAILAVNMLLHDKLVAAPLDMPFGFEAEPARVFG